ncbi:outer membrane protein W [Moraxella lacunata]|uniref:Outer membrane protein W n=1 Tax=Moraxella lacunata TaxID=477 RepID=A0A378TPT0_MORLA|nr:OmpW family outer membrane protein [Moraxella lacunata]STZ62828.1 outer membrane protein W [Moraxella lacunata]
MLKHILLATSVIALSATASANLTFKAGLGYLDPTAEKDIAAGLPNAKASSEMAVLPSFDYRFANSPFSAELLLASPFEHTVSVGANDANRGDVAKFKHLPPTLTFKYNTPEYNGFGANIGIGATVLVPYEEELLGSNAKLEADTVVAPAAQIGVTYSKPSSPWGVFADVRYVDLKTDLEVDGAKIGELEVNPVVYALGVSHKF